MIRTILVLALLAWIVLFGIISVLWGVGSGSLPLVVIGLIACAVSINLFHRVGKFPKPPTHPDN